MLIKELKIKPISTFTLEAALSYPPSFCTEEYSEIHIRFLFGKTPNKYNLIFTSY